MSRANCGVLWTTQHCVSPPSVSVLTLPCRRLAVMLDAQDTTSEPTMCAPSMLSFTFRGLSTANISAHTEDRISLRCFLSSSVGLAPNAHCSDARVLAAAGEPSCSLAVSASRSAHLPLCDMATKSKVPRGLPRGPEASSHLRLGPSPPTGVMAPTHCGRTTSVDPSARKSARGRRPPAPMYLTTPSSKGVKDPSFSVPTLSAGHSARRPSLAHSLAMDSNLEPSVHVMYCVEWSKEKRRPLSAASLLDARPPHACSPVSKTVACRPLDASSLPRTRPETPPPTTAMRGTYTMELLCFVEWISLSLGSRFPVRRERENKFGHVARSQQGGPVSLSSLW